MENFITPGNEYMTGFNQGYLIAEHLPELSDDIARVDSQAERLQGMKDGRNEYILEKSKDLMPSWLKPDNKEQPLNDLSKDRDIEPEK